MPAQDYTTTYAGVADDVFEDNDSFGTAAVVPMGTIIPDLVLRDQDWFKFYISGDDAGKTLGVRLTATSFPDGGAYADPNLLHDLDYGIMDSTGKLIHHSMSGDVDEVSFIPDIAEGWYYIAHHYVVNPGMVYSLFVVASNDLPVGTISGRVTDGADQGIDGVTVELWGLPFDWNKSRPMAVTDSDGYYKIASFSGDYLAQVNLRDFNQNPVDGLPDGWLPIRNFRASSYDYQKIVTVIPGTPVTGADVVLEPGGTISGRVTDGQGNPLHLAIVTAYNASAGQASYAYTDADGHYAILRLRTANYGIGFCPPTGNTLGREWYGGGSSFAGVRPVAVTAGATTSGIDAALEEGAYVSGRVADAGDNPIQGVQVTAHDVSGIALQSAVTQADGTYLIGRLPGGSVKILFNAVPCFAGNYFSEWYTDKRSVGEADPVLVTVGQTTTDIDAVLSPAGAIAGRLTDNDGKGLLSGYVSCVGEDGSYFHGAQPDHEGNYVVRNLPPNNYRVRFSYTFSSITNYPPEWYPEANRMEEAGLLAVGPGETVNGIDGMLEHDGGVIPGRVTNASGTGLAGLMVMASEQNWGGTTSAAMTDANGYYTVLNVPQGTAKVLFNTDASNSLYASEYYNNKPDFGSADTISVGIPDIDALLAERAALTVTTTSLAAGQLGVAYDQPLAVTGGRTFYHWTVSAGALPDGLTMGARGRITGMPTMAGTFNFTARVSDSTSPQQVTTKDLSITVGTYTGEGYTISGTVLLGGQPLAGVVLNGLPGSPVTNAAGGYVAVVQAGWAATVTPTLAGYVFDPFDRPYSPVYSNFSGQDYAATAGCRISGTVTLEGAAFVGVTMSGLPGSPVTGVYGDYNGIVPVGWSGTVTPTLEGYTFVPESRTYPSMMASITGEDYVATAVAPISAKVDFNGDGQEDILWRYYGEGTYQGMNLVWLMNQTGGSAPLTLSASPVPTRGKGEVMGSRAGLTPRIPAATGISKKTQRQLKGGIRSVLTRGKGLVQKPKLTMRDPMGVGRNLSATDQESLSSKGKRGVPVREGAVDTAVKGQAQIAAFNLNQEAMLPPVPDLTWKIAGVGDFDGDGDTDIFWRNYGTGPLQGLNIIWFMTGLGFDSEYVHSQVSDTGWKIVGTADFDGDRDLDILWRFDGTGALQGLNLIWHMNGTAFQYETVFSQITDTNWKIVGTGDFNGDGNTDILWRFEGTGALQGLNIIWYMNGTTVLEEAVFSQITDTAWEIAATGDFNNDGQTDILWRYYGTGAYQGLNDIWYMNGTSFQSEEIFSVIADTNWRIVNR